MHVEVRIQFNPVKDADWEAMRDMANKLTHRKASVEVVADEKPNWLMAKFMMPTEAQYKAVDKIDKVIRLYVTSRWDTTINFRPTEAAKARADRKAEKAKAKRAANPKPKKKPKEERPPLDRSKLSAEQQQFMALLEEAMKDMSIFEMETFLARVLVQGIRELDTNRSASEEPPPQD